MEIEFLNLLDNERSVHNIECLMKENKYKFSIEKDEYEISIFDNELHISRMGEISYINKHKKGKITKSNMSLKDMSFDVYIVTTKLDIDDKNINLMYNMYSDRNAVNLISSFDIKIKF